MIAGLAALLYGCGQQACAVPSTRHGLHCQNTMSEARCGIDSGSSDALCCGPGR